jgi:glycosyltransferase involved in cell wall biosynthesis
LNVQTLKRFVMCASLAIRPYTAVVSRRLTVLHLVDKNRLTTGSVVQMLMAAQGLAERGHEVWVGSRAGGDLESACAETGLPFLELPLRGVADPRSVSKLRRHLRINNTEILHVHKGRAHSVGLAAAVGMGRLPRMVVNRGVTFEFDGFNKWKYRHPRVGAVVCVADAVRRIVVRSGGLDRVRVHTVHGGTDTGSFDPARVDGAGVRRELDLDHEHLLIGQISVRDWKGWPDLIQAFAGITDRFPNARLLLVGCESEEERSKVDEKVRDAGLVDRILTLPYRTDMPEVMAACDVVADASWAGTGVTGTIREAMAMARTVVATDCGGNRELVIDGEVGLLVPPRDTDAFASALIRLLEDPALRQRFGAAARERVVEHFTTEHRIDKLEALYRDVLS